MNESLVDLDDRGGCRLHWHVDGLPLRHGNSDHARLRDHHDSLLGRLGAAGTATKDDAHDEERQATDTADDTSGDGCDVERGDGPGGRADVSASVAVLIGGARRRGTGARGAADIVGTRLGGEAIGDAISSIIERRSAEITSIGIGVPVFLEDALRRRGKGGTGSAGRRG